MDVILSSGFLAFARHCGVIEAIESRHLQVDAVCGTSSGALVGAFWMAGFSPEAIQNELLEMAPYRLLAPSYTPWRGLFSMNRLIDRLKKSLPPSFSDLPRPFGVGICERGQGHRILKEGSLPEAIAASCAMPYIFSPVRISGGLFYDGGSLDRVGATAWRKERPSPAIVHIVDRTAGAKTVSGLDSCMVIRTPRSNASFWSLRDFETQRNEAKALALKQLEGDQS